MRCQWVGTGSSRNSGMASTLTGFFVAHVISGSSNVTTAVFATEQTGTEKIERTILTFGTLTTGYGRLTSALTRLGIASIKRTNGPVDEAFAVFTTMRIAGVQIPVQRSTLIADPSLNPFLTLTQLSSRHGSTSGKLGNNSRRITVTLLARWEVIEPFLALVTRLTIKVVRALTLTLVVTGQPDRSMGITVARQTLRILVVTRHTHGTLTTREV